ncbi:hypothetical protein [Variovorax sp. J22R115]|uniref:hypothetical protein n=1 Tax=Variovorax sp. J22R115 TaxID=3053509 RepID=UPI0025763183|nr:hypothetical protein [Variovorax sp. J22R115]MDM0052978.1 hypothetical protein [Variovorax sp. J22R115]
MKTASYVTMLVRSHVRGTPVMPPKELEELRCAAGLLASFHRQFRSLGANAVASSNAQSDGHAPWADVGRVIEGVGDAVASVVRANLISWEAGRA